MFRMTGIRRLAAMRQRLRVEQNKTIKAQAYWTDRIAYELRGVVRPHVLNFARARKAVCTRRINKLHFDIEALDMAIGALQEGA